MSTRKGQTTKKKMLGLTRKVQKASTVRARGRTAGGLKTQLGRMGVKDIKLDTAGGIRWAMANLHPCNERQTEAVAYPDDVSVPTHCTRMQRTITVSPPGATCSTNTGPSIDQCSWNLCVITTPWPEYPWLVCATEGNKEPPRLIDYFKSKGIIYNGDDLKHPGVTKWDAWYFFGYPNFTDRAALQEFSDRGQRDKDGNATFSWDVNDVRTKYQQLRVVAKGTTTYLNASRLYDGGRVICGQYPMASKFIDTFNTQSVSIDVEKIADEIIKRLCVKGAGSFTPEEVRRITEHTHSVSGVTPDGLAVKDLEHSHTMVAELNASDVERKHVHPVSGVTNDGLAVADSWVGSHKHRVITSIAAKDIQQRARHWHTVPVTPEGVNSETEATARLGPSDVKHAHDVAQYFTGSELKAAVDGGTDLRRTVESGGVKWSGSSQVDLPVDFKKQPQFAGTAKDYSSDWPVWQLEASLPIDVNTLQAIGAPASLPIKTDLVTSDAKYDGEGDAIKIAGETDDLRWNSQQIPINTNLPTSTPVYKDQQLADETCLEISKQGDPIKAHKLINDDEQDDNPDWFTSEPPVNEQMLFYGDAKATTWEARKGTYQVLRCPNLAMQNCEAGKVTWYDLADWKLKQPFQPGDVSPEQLNFTVNTSGVGMWAVAYYRNINKATSVTLKSVQYTQGVVNPSGPFANLTPINTDPDAAAIALVTEENRRLAHAYPANYNDLGQILGEVFKVAKSVGKAINAATGQLSEVPVIGDIAKTINGLLSGFGL